MPQRKLEDMLDQKDIDKIINLYQNNFSLREIEKHVPATRAAISGMLTRMNIKTTTGNHYRKYFFNFDFFEKIDNELNAYWLGFLYADGCILPKREYGEQEFKLQLSIKDEEILHKYKEDLQSTYPIRYDRSKSHCTQVICSYRSQKTVEDLKKLGCVERKSLILNFPNEEQVPNSLIYHFIRGYFDGDGSITYNGKSAGISFIGTESFIKTLSTYFKGGSVYPDKRKTNSWYYNLGGNFQVIQAYHLMYDNATRYLQRKYLKFQPLIKKYSES